MCLDVKNKALFVSTVKTSLYSTIMLAHCTIMHIHEHIPLNVSMDIPYKLLAPSWIIQAIYEHSISKKHHIHFLNDW